MVGLPGTDFWLGFRGVAVQAWGSQSGLWGQELWRSGSWRVSGEHGGPEEFKAKALKAELTRKEPSFIP